MIVRGLAAPSAPSARSPPPHRLRRTTSLREVAGGRDGLLGARRVTPRRQLAPRWPRRGSGRGRRGQAYIQRRSKANRSTASRSLAPAMRWSPITVATMRGGDRAAADVVEQVAERFVREQRVTMLGQQTVDRR